MKTNRTTAGVMMAGIGLLFTIGIQVAQSQIIKKTEPAYPAKTKVLKPDIVVSGFQVTWSAGQTQGIYYTAPFKVTVRNAGLIKTAVPFYVALQYATASSPVFQGENTGDNCFLVSALLSPNETYILQGNLKIISSNMAGQTTRFRAIADVDCLNEFPSPNGKIDESQENNNYSNELSYTSGYLPRLDKVSPDLCIKGLTHCMLSGSSLAPQQQNYTLVIEQYGVKTELATENWASSYIRFTLPATVNVGKNLLYIAEKATMNKVSNAIEFTVGEISRVPWADILSPFQITNPLFKLRLHNWSGNSSPQNQSLFTYPVSANETKDMVVDLPQTEMKNWAGHYRFMFNDMSSQNFGFDFNRTNCNSNQFRLNIIFESDGIEMVGYYKVLGPAGEWRRAGAPDIHINNGNLDNLFTLYYQNGTLNYFVKTSFTADVNAANKVEDAFLDYFKASWNDDIRAKIAYEMQMKLGSEAMKPQIINMIMQQVRGKMPDGRTITKIEFSQDALLVTNY